MEKIIFSKVNLQVYCPCQEQDPVLKMQTVIKFKLAISIIRVLISKQTLEECQVTVPNNTKFHSVSLIKELVEALVPLANLDAG